MARPADWSALGLDDDPTPGDPDRIDDLITSQDDLVELANTIDSGLTEILNTTDGAFVGKTADALRDLIDTDLRKYVTSFRQAHVDVQSALRTYAGAMREEQRRADEALSAAAQLAEDDDAGREAHKATAEDAKETLQDAASTAAEAIRDATDSIASPVDECEEFWKALGWLALILVIPAMIVGGPLALFTIALNVALLIKTAVDFSQGKAGITELVLSILGVIAPTTKGLNIGQVFRGLKGAGAGAWQGTRNLFLGGPNSFGLFGRLTLGIDDAFRATGVWLGGVRGLGGLKSIPPMTFMPGLKGFTMGGSFGKGFGVVPAATELTVINLMGARTFFGVRSVITGLNGFRGLGASFTTLGRSMVNGVRGLNGLRFFLPVAADELGHGVLFALRIGVIDRGVFGMYRYGAFAGGQFLGAGSKISGGIAAGLDVLRPGAGLGSLSGVNPGGLSGVGSLGNFASGGLGSGLRALPPASIADSIGTVNTSGFNGLTGISAPGPGMGAKVVDIPSVGAFGGAGGLDLPTLGPVTSIAAPGTGNGLHVSAGGATAGVGAALDGSRVSVPTLTSLGVGDARFVPQTVDAAQLDGLSAVPTPSTSGVHLTTVGQVDVPNTGQLNVPSLGSVASGPNAVRVDMPSVDARVTDIPAVGAVGRVTLPTTGQLDVPSVNVSPVGSGAVGSAQVHVPSVAPGGVPSGSVAQGGVPSVNIAQGGVPSVNIAQGSVPPVSVTHGGVPPVNVPQGGASSADLSQTGVHAVAPGGAHAAAQTGVPHLNAPGAALDATHVNVAAVTPIRTEGLGAGSTNRASAAGATAPPSPSVPTPSAPAPAKTGGAPGSGSFVVDLLKMGHVDLAALAFRTVEIRMVHVPPVGNNIPLQQLTPPNPAQSSTTASAPATQTPVAVPVPAPLNLSVPGLNNAAIQVQLAPNGAITAVHTTSPALHTRHLTGAGPNNTDLVRVERTVSPVEIHRLDLTVNGNALAPVAETRLITLSGGHYQQTTLGIDVLNAGTVRHLGGTGPAPTGTPRLVNGELNLPTPNGFETYDPATGLPTRTGTQLTGGDGNALYAVTTPGGPTVRLTDASAVPHPGGSVTPVQGVYHVRTAQTPPGVVDVHTTNGVFTHQAITVEGGGYLHRTGGQFVDATGNPINGTTVVPQPGNAFRIDDGTRHIVVGPDGLRTHDVIALQGTNDLVHVPTGGARTPVRVDGAGANQGPVTRVGTDFHVPAPGNRTTVHNTTGTHTHDLLTLQAGPLAGSHLHVDLTGTVRHATATPGGPPTHSVIPLQGTDDLVLTPTGASGTTARISTAGVDQGPVTRVGTDFHVPAPGNRTTVYNATGTHTHDLLTVQGGPLTGSTLHVNLDGTAALDSATVVPQPAGAFRIQRGSDHIAVNAQGVHTDDIATLPPAQGNGLVHTPVTGTNPVPVLKDANGVPVPHATVATRPGGFEITRAIVDSGGAPVGTSLRIHPGGGAEVLDGALARFNGSTVTARPNGGFRVEHDGNIGLLDTNGRIDFAATDTAGNGGFHVYDGQGTHQFDMVRLSDSAGALVVRTDTHTLLDGELNPVTSGGLGRPQGGGYRLDGFGGPRAGEYKLYDDLGRLTEQRINIVDKGVPKPNEYFRVIHPTDGVTKPSWQRVTLDGAGAPRPVTGVRAWYDGGTVDTKGLGAGRVRLLGNSGIEVLDRRPLPDGHVVDAYRSTAGVGSFGFFNQRGGWTEYGADGSVARFGTRHWGESGRSWFDVTKTHGLDTRVRHFQETPDGGHVLANLNNKPLTQSFATSDWTRFDAEFRPIAHGSRDWGPGRGFTDTMTDPKSGASVVVHEKWGRFTFSPHDVRRFHQTEIGADGVPTRNYTSFSAHGKENGAGVTLKNGDFLEIRRFAEQRPPVSWRWLASGDYRATDLGAVPWLKSDSRLQVFHFSQTPAGGGAPVHGVRFVSGSTTTDILRTGEVVREVRKLTNGDTLTVGDVRMPDGVAARRDYLPWSQGTGKPQGHRTYVAGDFTSPTIDGRRVVWQDRVDVGPHANGGDWYTPNAPGRTWNVVRSGLDDGTVVEYRPAPGQQTPARLGNGDWTRYDHHGLVVARQDTWPHPTGTGNDIRVTATDMRDGRVRWTDSLGNGGVRKVNYQRGEVTPWGWDRESYQDFDAAGQLVRDHRMLSGGTTVGSWPVPDAGAGGRTWHWNKVQADGTVRNFGTGGGDRIREWYGPDGTRLDDWRRGAVFKDQVTSLGNQVVQEIPAKPAGASWLTDVPHRVREYVPDPAGGFHPHVWKEFENGTEIGRKVQLGDGTFLESEDWHKQWRRYGTNGTSLIDERTVSGYVWHTDTFGRVSLIGRETNFTGLLHDFRGFNRTWREANTWQWGPSLGGVSTYTPFAYKAGRQLVVEIVQEWILDFAMNLAVYGIVAAATGTPFGAMDVAKAAFGATVSAGVKGTFSAGHLATFRGGPWRTGFGQVDEGNPYTRRPMDKNWADEYGGNEKVIRWRSGGYDFGVGLMSGMASGFVGGAATAAIFGVKDKNGNTVHLYGTDALLAGAIGMAGGAIAGVSTGLGRNLITNNLAGRWYHRGGFFDTIAVGAVGKLIDKSFYQLFLMKDLTVSVNPGYYGGGSTGDQGKGAPA
ncbi:hypothetical protein ABZ896_03980 [Streptomyces sp. NPDC047072]|uniref:hypothetical protein n=1 Tax=Streptomyces sp. NPDC047072 TaxID=3154809 RepID=UPI0033D0970E